jgi:hypothetical protein
VNIEREEERTQPRAVHAPFLAGKPARRWTTGCAPDEEEKSSRVGGSLPQPRERTRWRPADVAFFDELMNRHLPRAFIRLMRLLPSDPRCQLCHAPYGGVGGKMMRRFGFGPSRKNPNLCNTCFETAPMGVVEMEIGVLFADVRGLTSLSERLPPGHVAQLLNRFYAVASEVLTRSAIIDKLVPTLAMSAPARSRTSPLSGMSSIQLHAFSPPPGQDRSSCLSDCSAASPTARPESIRPPLPGCAQPSPRPG